MLEYIKNAPTKCNNASDKCYFVIYMYRQFSTGANKDKKG